MTLLVQKFSAQKVPPHLGLHANYLKARNAGEIMLPLMGGGSYYASVCLMNPGISSCDCVQDQGVVSGGGWGCTAVLGYQEHKMGKAS